MAIFLAYFRDADFGRLQECAIQNGCTEQEWKKFVAYAAGFYSNMSNYQSFGHNKFVPDLPDFKKFTQILNSHPDRKQSNSLISEVLDQTLPLIDKEVLSTEKPYTALGFPYEEGVTAYFSRNMTAEDLKLVNEVLTSEKVEVYNTRAFKEANGDIIITVGSIEKRSVKVEHAGRKFEFRYGEFSHYIEEVNYWLTKALPYCANETQR